MIRNLSSFYELAEQCTTLLSDESNEVFESDALHERARFCKLREQNIMTYLTLNEKARSFW